MDDSVIDSNSIFCNLNLKLLPIHCHISHDNLSRNINMYLLN